MAPRDKVSIEKDVFIGHDFSLRGGRKTIFRNTVMTALKGTSYCPLYSDDIKGRKTNVLNDITQKIASSETCIFDLTGYKKKGRPGKNLNVILEIGISIGLGKTPFVAYKKGSINFEKELSDYLGLWRYEYTTYKKLGQEIKLHIKSLQVNTKRRKR